MGDGGGFGESPWLLCPGSCMRGSREGRWTLKQEQCVFLNLQVAHLHRTRSCGTVETDHMEINNWHLVVCIECQNDLSFKYSQFLEHLT